MFMWLINQLMLVTTCGTHNDAIMQCAAQGHHFNFIAPFWGPLLSFINVLYILLLVSKLPLLYAMKKSIIPQKKQILIT